MYALRLDAIKPFHRLQKYRKVGEIDERNLIRKKETEVAATKLTPSAGAATPPSMTKCQVGTPIRSTR